MVLFKRCGALIPHDVMQRIAKQSVGLPPTKSVELRFVGSLLVFLGDRKDRGTAFLSYGCHAFLWGLPLCSPQDGVRGCARERTSLGNANYNV